MEFRILGQVELWADGKRYALGSRKERGVLAVLVWELRPVPAEILISRIWGDEPSDSAPKSLHESVSRLRKSLRMAGGTGQELSQRSGSYVLDVSRQDVDAWQFRMLRDQAREAMGLGDDERAFDLLEAADALWGGIPLDGLDGYWAEGVRVRLAEERLAGTLQRLKASLRLERYSDLVSEIAPLVRQQPPNEELLDLYLRALHGSGRKAEALSAYSAAKRRWREESGADLGPALRDLHGLMLRDDPTLSAKPSPRGPARLLGANAASPAAPSSTMPRDNPDFTGRAAEMRTLAAWLNSDEVQSSVAVAVVSGMTGVGKSTLAVRAAHSLRERYPNQLHLSLHGHDADSEPIKPNGALGTLLRMLGLPDTAIPVDTESRAALWRHMLNGRNTLIMLDDALNADQVLPLLPGTPGALVLVTTRRRTLGIPGALSLPLRPMPYDDAAALFVRAAGVGGGQARDRASISRVVRLCGRVPLAIQLAGSRLRGHPAWSVQDLASRLADMRSGDRDMTAAFALSYRYLTVGQQRLFRWLALHPGDSFSFHAAVAMADDASPATTELALEVLLDYHLIEEPVPGRYEFHALLHEYAAGLTDDLDSEEERLLVIKRLLDYCLRLLDRADRIVHPVRRRTALPDAIDPPVLPPLRTRRECLQMLDTEKASMLAIARYAATHGWPRHAALFARLLGPFLDTWGDWADAIDLHRRAVHAWRSTGDASGEAAALVDLGFILCLAGQQVEAEERLLEALAIAQETADIPCEAAARDTMGIIQVWSGQYEESLASHDRALLLWRQLHDRQGAADALSHGVLPTERLGRHRDALARAELALAAYHELGDAHGETKALNNLGGLQQDAGCYDDALVSYEQAMARFLEIGDRRGVGIALTNIGDIRRLSGSHREAIWSYREALSILREIGDRRTETEALNGMADTFASAGDRQAALHHYKMALALASELAERHVQAISHLGIGAVHLVMGRYLLATDDYRVALRLSREVADPVQEGRALYGLGCALLATEGAAAAREHWQAALSVFEATGNPEADNVRARLTAPAGS